MFSSRAWATMSLKIMDWTEWTYMSRVFLGTCLRFWMLLRYELSSWISLTALSKFLFRICFPIFMLSWLMPNLCGPK